MLFDFFICRKIRKTNKRQKKKKLRKSGKKVEVQIKYFDKKVNFSDFALDKPKSRFKMKKKKTNSHGFVFCLLQHKK